MNNREALNELLRQGNMKKGLAGNYCNISPCSFLKTSAKIVVNIQSAG